MPKSLRTVLVLTKLNTRRYFRDRLAIFFTVAFPLIFLFIFGGIFGNNNGISFNIVIINQSNSLAASQFVDGLKKQKDLFKINSEISNYPDAREKMSRGELDAIVILPQQFGQLSEKGYPEGEVSVQYSQNNTQAAQTLANVLETNLQTLGAKYVASITPFVVKTEQTNDNALSQFDYTFTGLLGFAIIGLGIFGPIQVFPELKKQGILRRLHTTPLRVWQYFLSQMFSQAIIGIFSISILFGVAISLFNLEVTGNVIELGLFIILGIVTILGIGLAVGGWAKNERQAAPLGNMIVFPLLFLSGTFFPRFLMPQWLQDFSNFLPLTPIIDGIRLIATEGKHLIDIIPQIGLTALWAVIIYIIAFRVFRWE